MVKRELYMSKIRPFINTELVKVLTGMRRSGKTVMLELLKQELLELGINPNNIIQLNFESITDQRVKSTEALIRFLQETTQKTEGKLYLFFDEVQELLGWEKLVNACLIDFETDIYITGSNAKLLSGELATYLGGRYVEFKIYPFSFKEVIELNKTRNEVIQEASLFLEYVQYGGMPFLYQYNFDTVAKDQYLNDIFNSIILKDISLRNKIRDIDQLKRIILFFIANIGNVFSAESIVKYLKNEKRQISHETLYNYIKYCQEACLLHLVPREDLVGKKLMSFQEKIYISDHGIKQALYGNNQRDIQQILENIIYMELLRRGYEVYIGKQGNQEVDFCAHKGSEKFYIQVCYLLASEDTIEREFSVLEKIADNYPKYVLSLDEVEQSRNGMRHMNIRKFLLNTEEIALK